MMVIFLVGLVSMILMRTLRKDYARYSRDEDMDDMERDLGDEYGWKQVHGDVFRPASHAMLFSALIGAGYQVRIYSGEVEDAEHILPAASRPCFLLAYTQAYVSSLRTYRSQWWC